MAEAREHRIVGLALAAAIFIADQLSKYVVTVVLSLRERGTIELLPVFNLTWVENYGVSMGFLRADSDTMRWALVALTAAITVGVAVWLWREKRQGDIAALGLVLGGALGNIVDRVRFGYVVDFADLHFGSFRPFLVFNVADAAITIGVLILLVRAILIRDPGQPKESIDA